MLATAEFYRKMIARCKDGLKTAGDQGPLLARLEEYRDDLAKVTHQKTLRGN